MLYFFLLTVLFSLSFSCEADDELLWEANFMTLSAQISSTPCFQKYVQTGIGPDGKGALEFRATSEVTNWCRIPLDPHKMQGTIRMEALVSGEDLKRGKQSYYGSKVMLHVQRSGNNALWPEIPRKYGTFDWILFSKTTFIPNDTKNLTLHLGIQNGHGIFRVAWVKIYRITDTQKTAPPPKVPNREALCIPRGPGIGAAYRGVMSGRDLSPAAIRQLAEWNVNLLRYQFNPSISVPSPDISSREKYLAWIEKEMVRFDSVLKLCQKYGIYVVIDLHAGPGNCRSTAASNRIDTGLDVKTLQETWCRIASRYRHSSHIYGYDLLNEPIGDLALWQEISEQIAKAIRRIDPKTPIIVGAGFSTSEFGDFQPLNLKNIIYSPHFYEPHSYTHQGVNGKDVRWKYPGWIDGVYWNKDQLRVSMRDAIEFQKKYGLQIYVGEFSVIAWAEGGEDYLKDMISLLEEYGWDWTYHAFREWNGWSIEHQVDDNGLLKFSDHNPRKKILLKAFQKNTD